MLNRAALEGGVNLSEFEDTIYKIQTLSSPDQENNYGISTYTIKGDIDDRQMSILLEYDPMLKNQKIINVSYKYS